MDSVTGSGTDPTIANYWWMTVLAFCGAFMRSQRWRRDNGSLDVIKMLVEIPVAVSFGAVAVGVGAYYGLSMPVVGGIAGLLGLLGPAGVDAAIGIIKWRLGANKASP